MFAFDTETIPLAEALAAPFDRSTVEPPANYKNPEAIEKFFVSAEEKWRERRVKECSLNPRLGRIVAIGYADAQAEHAELAQWPTDEHALLAEFWKRAKRAVDESRHLPHLITWNGDFDLRFILVRSMLLGVEHHLHQSVIRAWLRRYDLRTHFDVKAALLNHDRALMMSSAEGMDAWATAFGLPTKPSHGSEVYGLVLNGEWDALRGYVQHDARSTWQLFARVAPYLAGGE